MSLQQESEGSAFVLNVYLFYLISMPGTKVGHGKCTV